MKIKFLVPLVAGISLASLSSVSATTISGFGSIPGANAADNPYSGHGIPIDASEWTQVTGLAGSDTLTIALSATAHGSSNPTPGNDGAGTFTVNTGLVGGRSVWNFDFYANSSANLLGNYIFTLTEKGNGQTFTFDPSAIGDNVGGPNSFGNSESLDFATYGVPLNYDANANATYLFDLDVKSVTGAPIAHDSITVIAGTGSTVPDGGSTAVLLGCGVIGLALVGRRQVRSSIVAK